MILRIDDVISASKSKGAGAPSGGASGCGGAGAGGYGGYEGMEEE